MIASPMRASKRSSCCFSSISSPSPESPSFEFIVLRRTREPPRGGRRVALHGVADGIVPRDVRHVPDHGRLFYRPDVVVAEPEAASRVRLEWPEHVPVMEMNGEMRDNPDALVEAIREAIRANQIVDFPNRIV